MHSLSWSGRNVPMGWLTSTLTEKCPTGDGRLTRGRGSRVCHRPASSGMIRKPTIG